MLIKTNFISINNSNPAALGMSFRAVPSLKIIGFRNFIPLDEDQTTTEPNQEQKSIDLTNQTRDITKDPMSPVSIVSISPATGTEARKNSFMLRSESMISLAEKISKDSDVEKGPFMVFLLTEFSKRGNPTIVDELRCIEIEYPFENVCTASDWFNENSFVTSTVKLKENESILIIPEKVFNHKIASYFLQEDCWLEMGFQSLSEKVVSLRNTLINKHQICPNEMINLETLKAGVYGEIWKGFHRNSHHFFCNRSIPIKTVHVMTLVLNEMEILERIVNSGHRDLINIYDIRLTENQNEARLYLDITLEYGFGTLEDFANFRGQNNQEWREEELLMIIMDLLNQVNLLKSLNICKRGTTPSDIIIRRDFKGLKFLDYSLSCLLGNDSEKCQNGIFGSPKFMSPEIKHGLKYQTSTKHSDFLSELYSIGATIFCLIFSNRPDGNTESTELINKHSIHFVEKKYPILWKKYLKNLIDSKPHARESVLKGGITQNRTFLFFEKERRQFESFIAQRTFTANKDPLVEYKTFLPYLWELKNYDLIAEMQSCIIQEFHENPSLFRKAKKFLEELASLYEKEAKQTEAALTLEKLIEVVEKFRDIREHKKDEYDRLISELHSKIGNLYKVKGTYNKALENYEKAVFIEFLKDSEHQAHVIKTYFDMADLYDKLGQEVLALDTYSKIENILNDLYKGNWNHLEEAILSERLGRIYFKQGRLYEALEKIERARVNYYVCYGELHSTVIDCHYWLGKIYAKMQSTEEAIQHYETYCQAKYSGAKDFDSETARLFEYIAVHLESQEKHTEALEHYEKALYIYEQNDDEEALCTIYEKIGESYVKQKKNLIAIKNFRLSYQTNMVIHGKNHMSLVPIIEKVGDFLVKEGENKEALEEYSRALNILNAQPTEDEVMIARLLKKIGKVSPLVFLAYRNYNKTSGSPKRSASPVSQKEISLLIGWDKVDDVKGVLEKAPLQASLLEIREMIEKECPYFKFFKYHFVCGENQVENFQEKETILGDCIIKQNGYNYIVIKEDTKFSRFGKQRKTC